MSIMVIMFFGTIHMSKIKEISLIGVLASVNIASRVALQSLPNIKPMTAILMISVMIFGLAFAIKLTIVTVLVSNLFLGLGIWTFFQIFAWIVIVLLTDFIVEIFRKRNKEPSLLMMASFAFVMGYVFGIVVSLEKLVIGGFSMYFVYYMSGLVFDTLHACGNFMFYFICAPFLLKIFENDRKVLL